MAIERFSSRREALGDVLTARLTGASRYLRIAGYFRSSLLEVVGEALETRRRDPRRLQRRPRSARCEGRAKPPATGRRRWRARWFHRWQSTEDGLDLLLARERYRRLHDLLASGRMKVRVVPRDATTYSCTARRA